MNDRLKFLLNRMREKLWIKPLFMCILSISGAFIARLADFTDPWPLVPEITSASIRTLLTTLSSSMLVIATFSVASMVSAYASVSAIATPRSFPLVVADDVSQNALSAFVGALIFSIVALIALENGYYERTGRFVLLVLTLFVFTVVIMTFIRWVDRIARLGRLETAIEKIETAATRAMESRVNNPRLGGKKIYDSEADQIPIYCESIGYIQLIEVDTLQCIAEQAGIDIELATLPGKFITPDKPLAFLRGKGSTSDSIDHDKIVKAFLVGKDRTFDDDPRFGLIVLAEIASRALSPGVNDSGTAIRVIGSLVRVISLWPPIQGESNDPEFDRVAVPDLSLEDLFDDAFAAIARDGAGTVEVVVRLLKALKALAHTGNEAMAELARQHGRLILERAEQAITIDSDLKRVRAQARLIV